MSQSEEKVSKTQVTLHDDIRAHVARRLADSISSMGVELEAAGLSLRWLCESLVSPPEPEMGDLAFGCFPLAKSLKSAPAKVASDLQARLSTDEVIEDSVALGPYLNFRISMAAYGEKLLNPILSGAHFERCLVEGTTKTMVEFSQPNTHKELHVGHMRNLCLGDALVRLMRYAGWEIVTATFPGDMGTHVAKCLWYMKHHPSESPPVDRKGEWLGERYSKAHLKLEDEEGTPRGPTNRAEITAILKELESKTGESYELWKETRQWSIDLMKKVYQWAGVEIELWYWESEVDAASVDLVKKYLAEGKLIQSEGAVGMDLSEHGLGFFLLLKSDGTGLYATKDIELARRKFEEMGVEKSVYVVDMRQALHFKQVFKVLEILGFSRAADCYHLQYNFVELPDGAMSSRKGNIVPIMSLVEQMESTIKQRYLSRYEGEWSEEERNVVAHQVAQGAIKYGMTKMDNNKKIVFEMDGWLKIDGDSGPFIQYSHARVASLLRKLHYDPHREINWASLSAPAERKLVGKLLGFHFTVVNAAIQYRPAALCNFLYDLAKQFNVFYHECPIATAPTEELKVARLSLSAAVGAVLAKGLGLLGIPAPERM